MHSYVPSLHFLVIANKKNKKKSSHVNTTKLKDLSNICILISVLVIISVLIIFNVLIIINILIIISAVIIFINFFQTMSVEIVFGIPGSLKIREYEFKS